jgi:aminoglycoside phosphotransferase (APT) family kinase protein
VLTHFDLWEGNVFVVPHQGGHHIEAVVDGERAFWGDPLAELVSTSLFTDPRRATDFLAGLAEATGRPLVFTPEVQTRLGLYRAYLCTVMAVEGVPRGYRGAEAFATRRFALWRLRAELRAVERLVRG